LIELALRKGEYSENYHYVSSTQCLQGGVVEDFLWNSLDGNVLKQRGKDRSLEDLLPQKGHIGEMRAQLSPSIHPPLNPNYAVERKKGLTKGG
jgi:hypothetical protein